jgi:hypothetical protein
MYFAIYARDLPVLITADSILHAWHRSYDDILVELETGLFTDTITTVLAATHDELAARAARVGEASVRTSLEDVDLYLTVARTCSTAGVPRGGHRARTRRPQSARPGAFRRSSVRTRRWPSCSGVSRR